METIPKEEYFGFSRYLKYGTGLKEWLDLLSESGIPSLTFYAYSYSPFNQSWQKHGYSCAEEDSAVYGYGDYLKYPMIKGTESEDEHFAALYPLSAKARRTKAERLGEAFTLLDGYWTFTALTRAIRQDGEAYPVSCRFERSGYIGLRNGLVTDDIVLPDNVKRIRGIGTVRRILGYYTLFDEEPYKNGGCLLYDLEQKEGDKWLPRIYVLERKNGRCELHLVPSEGCGPWRAPPSNLLFSVSKKDKVDLALGEYLLREAMAGPVHVCDAIPLRNQIHEEQMFVFPEETDFAQQIADLEMIRSRLGRTVREEIGRFPAKVRSHVEALLDARSDEDVEVLKTVRVPMRKKESNSDTKKS